MPKIDWTLKAEAVIKILAVVLAIVVAWVNMQGQLSATRSDVAEIKSELREIRKELVGDRERGVRDSVRIDALEKDQVRQDRDMGRR